MNEKVPFSKPYRSKNEAKFIEQVLHSGKTAGGGKFTQIAQQQIQSSIGGNCLLTNSCTAALEISALLLDIQPGDEVILPSYTFPSTANSFLLRGATIKFVDSQANHPNMDLDHLEELISEKTKAIVPMYYGGVSSDWSRLKTLQEHYKFYIIEEAAQAFGASFKEKPLGSLGDLAVFSFHETKNISCGEGGALIINKRDWNAPAEIIWEKGTNRAAFKRGEIDKYEWVALGSSYVNSELNAAYLVAQLEESSTWLEARKKQWNYYFEQLSCLEEKGVLLPQIPDFANHNAHIFYLVLKSPEELQSLKIHLSENGIDALMHYRCLHKSSYFKEKYVGKPLTNAEKFESRLLRLPLHSDVPLDLIITKITDFFKAR
ncbi:MAG: dTDP-4-amino-4,6-dideoxygalactose transaminase [Flavobacteriales bacterium]|nr:dTDP-4-amino-4,6-dideoxygalactose transaminase [Flavobacteriales bacterium]